MSFQDVGHPRDHDYEKGSPHLLHTRIRSQVIDSLRESIGNIMANQGSCFVLEMGAGHGDFTDTLLGMGAQVVVTEMSDSSAEVLSSRYRYNSSVEVVLDPVGDWIYKTSKQFDAVVCISVLHHIPDYMLFIEEAFKRTTPGGAFISWQDPLWYPRRSRTNLLADKLAYLSWRVRQGEWKRGIQSISRRLRGILDESNPSDMVEYHVIREGVDELAIQKLGDKFFGRTAITTYWSTQSRTIQNLGSRTSLCSSFGFVFTNRLP